MGLARPESRGFLRLKSASPQEAMEIHANMLTDPRDLAALRRSMEITRELGNSEAMKPFVKREILPGDLEGEALDNLIRDGAMSMHHPTCTAKMGQDDLSVVDAQLRVYGVKKLRIADGSIMPTSFGWRYLMRPFPISFLRISRRSRCSSEESKHRDDGDCRQNVQQNSKRIAVALAKNRPADFWKARGSSGAPALSQPSLKEGTR